MDYLMDSEESSMTMAHSMKAVFPMESRIAIKLSSLEKMVYSIVVISKKIRPTDTANSPHLNCSIREYGKMICPMAKPGRSTVQSHSMKENSRPG